MIVTQITKNLLKRLFNSVQPHVCMHAFLYVRIYMYWFNWLKHVYQIRRINLGNLVCIINTGRESVSSTKSQKSLKKSSAQSSDYWPSNLTHEKDDSSVVGGCGWAGLIGMTVLTQSAAAQPQPPTAEESSFPCLLNCLELEIGQ